MCSKSKSRASGRCATTSWMRRERQPRPMTIDVLIIGRDSETFAAHLAPLFTGARFHRGRDSTEALAHCAPCEILIIRTDEIFAGLVAAMPKLRLIQALTTGTDHITALPNLPSDVVIAAARGF